MAVIPKEAIFDWSKVKPTSYAVFCILCEVKDSRSKDVYLELSTAEACGVKKSAYYYAFSELESKSWIRSNGTREGKKRWLLEKGFNKINSANVEKPHSTNAENSVNAENNLSANVENSANVEKLPHTPYKEFNINPPKQNTVPNGTDASASGKASLSATVGNPVGRRIWNDGAEILQLGGLTKSAAKSLLGKLVKTYGNESLAEAIAVTQAKNPVNPEEFLIGVLKRKSSPPQKPTGKDISSPDYVAPVKRNSFPEVIHLRFEVMSADPTAENYELTKTAFLSLEANKNYEFEIEEYEQSRDYRERFGEKKPGITGGSFAPGGYANGQAANQMPVSR